MRRIHRRAAVAAAALATLPLGLVAAGRTEASNPSGALPETDKAMAAAALAPVAAAPALPAAAPAPTEASVEHIRTVPGLTGGHVVVEGDRMYVGAYGFGLRIFDISEPGNPRQEGQYVPGPQPAAADPGARADTVPDAGDPAQFNGMHVVALGGTRRASSTTQTEFLDLSDPKNPRLLWRFTGAADGEAHNADIVDARRLWLPSGGAGANGLRIYDMNPLLLPFPNAPTEIARVDPRALWENSPYRNGRAIGPAFTHTHDIEVYVDHPVSQPDGTVAPRDIALLAEGGSYTANGNTGSIFVIDITDPANPVVLNRWLHESGPNHHPIRYHHEVQFLDGDPSVMIVTDEDLHNGCDAGGVTILRASGDLTSASELSEWFIGTGTPAPVCSAHVFSTWQDYLFIGSYNAGLQVVDLSDPANPVRAAQAILPGMNSWGAKYHEGYVYVGDFGARGLDVFRFTPASP